MSKVAWDYIVPVVLPKDLKGVEPGKLPANLLRPVKGGGKMHWLAAAAWDAMVTKAKADGVELKPTSAGDTYREYDLQRRGFLQRYQNAPIPGVKPKDFEGKKWYLKKGMAPLATPGKSQHNLGLAVDVHSASEPKRINWLIANVKDFGFSWEVVPEEPWHLRYVSGDNPPAAVRAYIEANGIKTPPMDTAPVKPAPAPAPKPEPAPVKGQMKELKKGDKGPQVRQLQQALVAKGVPTSIDGDFGQKTEGSVKRFQQANGLRPTGVVNAKTWDLLI